MSPSTSPLLVVQDANLLIDLHCGGLLACVFSPDTPWQVHVPDLILGELLRGTGPVAEALRPYQEEGRFITGALDGSQVVEAVGIQIEQRRLSLEDCAAFVYARSNGGILLTGDNQLRTYAQSQELPVHGTLWVLDQLVETWQVLPPSDGHQALTRISSPAAGRRLPTAECEARLARWQATSASS